MSAPDSTAVDDGVPVTRREFEILVDAFTDFVANQSGLTKDVTAVLTHLAKVVEGILSSTSALAASARREKYTDDLHDTLIERDEQGRMVRFRQVPPPLTADGSMPQAEFERQIERLTRDFGNGNGNGNGAST
jgi:hypothetical protein